MVPISVRTDDEHGALGNRVSAMMAPLPVWCEDPIERLRTMTSRMGDLKSSRQAVGASLLTEASDFAPPTIAAQAARLQSRQRFFNLVVTNVPGPSSRSTCSGASSRTSSPWCRWPRTRRVCFGIMSYNGRVNFGITADYDGMPDLDALAGETRAAIDGLSAAVSASGVSSAGVARGGRAAEPQAEAEGLVRRPTLRGSAVSECRRRSRRPAG